mmetsp:Transcript_73151/g.145484  ORF Transcript_73151/g.145484 Transcript_73151/m.145484 type:complete len:245 (-) Transcript_73151:86-820(-)
MHKRSRALCAKDEHGRTPLMLSCHNGEVAVLSALLNNGASTQPKTAAGTTALMMAAQAGQAGAVKLLLEAGALSNEEDTAGRLAWQYAEDQGHQEVVRLLVAHEKKVAEARENAAPAEGGGWKKLRRLSTAAAAARAFESEVDVPAGRKHPLGGFASLLSGHTHLGAQTLGWLRGVGNAVNVSASNLLQSSFNAGSESKNSSRRSFNRKSKEGSHKSRRSKSPSGGGGSSTVLGRDATTSPVVV